MEDPDRSDFRLILKIFKSSMPDLNAMPSAPELHKISRVFLSAGGSWRKVFLGSVEDMSLLKDLMKLSVKEGYVTKKPPWSTK